MKSLLIIDVSNFDLNTTTSILEKKYSDFRILSTTRPTEGIELAKNEKPEIILLNSTFPDYDAAEFCKQIRQFEITNSTPILITVTRGFESKKLEKILESGADSFISKPLNILELTTQIKILLHNKNIEDKIKQNFSVKHESKVIQKGYSYGEERFYELANLLPQIIYEHDFDGNLTFFNKQAYISLGYTKEEFNNSFNVLDVFLPDEKHIIIDNIKKIAKGKKPLNKTFKLLKKDGSTFPVLIYSSVIYKKRKAVGIRGVVIDISDQKKYEKQLEENEFRLKTLNSNISELILLDNPAKIYKYTVETLSRYVDNTIVICVSISKDEQFAKMEAIEGIGNNILENIIQISGFNPIGKNFRITSLHKSYFKTGELIKFKGGLQEFSAKQYPAAAIKLIQKFLNIKNIYTIGINKDENLLAAVHFLSFNDKDFSYKNYVTSFVKQLGLVLQNKLAEQSLKESESKFYELFDKSSDAILLLKNGKVIDCNKSFIETFKFQNKEDAINLYPNEFSPIRQPDGSLSSEKADKLIRKAIQNTSVRFEWNHMKTTGEIIPMEVILTTIKAEKDNEIIHAVMRDITERKKSDFELKESILNFRLIFENSPFGIYLANIKGEIIDANHALIEILGSPSIEETKKINVLEFQPLVSNGYAKKFKECHKTGKIIELEMEYVSKWGKPMSLHSFLVPLRDLKGEINTVYTLIEDITTRKQTEVALRESETRFAAFMNNLPAGIFIKDQNGNYLFSNKYNEDVHGLKNWKGKSVYDFFDKGIADEFSKNDKEILNGKKLYYDGNIININGEKIYFRNRQFAIEQADGSKLIGGISLDITKEKKAELELKESEDLYRTMIETSNDVIWMTDTKGKFTFINDLASKLVGIPKDEWIGRSFIPLIIPGDEEFILETFDKILKGETVNYEIRIKNINDEILTLQTNSTPIYKNGSLNGSISFARNITKQKKQELIRQIIFNISTAALTTDNLHQLTQLIQNELGRLIDTSNFYLTLNDKQTNSLNFPFFIDEYDNPQTFPSQKTLAHRIIKTKKPLLLSLQEQIELEKSGEIDNYGTRPLKWLGVPLKIDNEVIGIIAVQSYKSESAYTADDQEVLEFISGQISMAIYRKQAEENLKNALLKAEESDRLKSAFLANMSHEIRTPMNGILGFSQLIKDPTISREDHNKYVSIIEKSGERLLNIINDIVDISKIEAGQMDVFISSCDIHEQLHFLYTFFKPEAEIKGLKLSLNPIVTNEKLYLLTDREKLYAIFTNLIKNAVKYSRKGEIEFGYKIVSARKELLGDLETINSSLIKPDKMIEFYVKDTGIGIPKDRLNAIFDRFVQADIEDSNVFEGAGLGLSITKAYVEMLGGKIWVKSEENMGSEFYFTIPYLKEFLEEEENKTQSSDHQENIKRKNHKILIVEDEKISSDYLTAILSKTNSEIVHASNGKQAVEIVKDDSDIDLILMDIKMPIMGGHEATREIRKFNQKVIIIAQTAYALAGDADKSIKNGCNDYISKPIDSEELMSLIDKHLS